MSFRDDVANLALLHFGQLGDADLEARLALRHADLRNPTTAAPVTFSHIEIAALVHLVAARRVAALPRPIERAAINDMLARRLADSLAATVNDDPANAEDRALAARIFDEVIQLALSAAQ